MDAPIKSEILKYSFLSRTLIFILQVVFNLLIPDHNADTFNPPYNFDNDSILDKAIHLLLGGFIRWDGVYFLHIAQYGYTYENCLAFFPLFPWTVRIVANSLFYPFQFILQYRTVLVLSGFVLNFILFTKTAIVLYKLSKLLFDSEAIAFQSAILFCFNPASIFMSAFYSEILCTYLVFSAMWNFEYKNYKESLIFSSLSFVTRSNGLLTCGFQLHRTCQIIFSLIFNKNSGYIVKVVDILNQFAKLGVFFILFFLPFVLYQFYIRDIFCNQTVNADIPEFLVQYGIQRNYNLRGKTNFTWCKETISFSYNHVQSSHWNVGFLKYYEIKQIPNFILALPVTILSILSVIYYYNKNRRRCLMLGLIPEDDRRVQKEYGFNSRRMLPYIAYLLFITIFGWCFIHIQVLTRMVFSSSPVPYWFTAKVISSCPSSNDKDRRERSTKYANIIEENLINQIYNYKNQNKPIKCIILYFIGYFVIGTLMFSNFLPWT